MIKADRSARSWLALAFAVALATPAIALADACDQADSRPAAVARDWLARKPIGDLALADAGAARCFNQAFLKTLEPSLGPRIGYKVGLYSAAGQARYGAAAPVLGSLYARMLAPEGRVIPADYGVSPTWESDLLVVAGNEAINTAKTREEIYRNLRAIRPFIELTNGNFAQGVNVTVLQLTALGVFTPAKAPQPGDVVTVRYTPGKNTTSISARFR